MNSDKVFYGIITIVTVLIFAGILFLAARPQDTNNPNDPNNQSSQQIPLEELVGESPNASMDVSEAEVVVVEFGDFQCPACKSYWPQVTQIKEEFGDRVAVVYRHFPLTSIHDYAFDAAKASEAAARQDAFFEYHDALFRNQTDNNDPLDEEDFVGFAQELGLNVEQFQQDFNSSEVRDLVQEDSDYARSIGVNSTPTFFIDGQKFEGRDLYTAVQNMMQETSEEEVEENEEESVSEEE